MAPGLSFSKLLLLTLILSLFVDLYLQTPAQAQSSTPNVIAIGDSLTDDFGNGGWRAPLKTNLAVAGQSINYVGSRSDGAGNHEAYGGASSCDFFTDRGTFMATTYGKAETWDIRTALTAAAANIAIIYIGTTNYIEDYQLAQGLATTVPCGLNPSSLAWLWDSVVYQPGISGVVITTVEDSMIPNGTENVNVLVRKYVADRQAQGKNVCLGDLPSSFAGLTTDRYHLTAAGKDAVASALVTPTLKAIAGTCAADLPSLPVVTAAATIANAAEPSTNGQFTISRIGSTTNALTVNFTVSGTATAGTDYVNIGTSVVIPAGSASATIPVSVIDDTLNEGSETVVLTLNNNANYTLGSPSSATVTISDNDAPSGPTVSVTPSTPAQGDAVTVTWSGITSPAPRDWLGLYAAGSGNTSYLLWFYVSCSQGAVAGKASGACNTQIPGGLANGNYNFRLLSNDSYNLITSSNPVVVGLPVVSVAATANAAEPSTPGQFTFTRTGTTANPLTVPFTVGGSATPGTDYASIGTSVVIPAGSAAATIAISVIDDSVYEGTETVVVTLTPNSAYGLGLATATVSILDDDKPVVTIIATDAAAAEAGLDAGTFRVSRDGVTTAPLTINYAVGGTATNGVDYQLLTGALTIPAGQASANITVAPINDSLFEGPETVILTLSSSANYTVGNPNNATVTIEDDDKPVVTIAATDALAAEAGLDTGTFTITRDGITTAALIVNYSIGGTATNAVDYQPLSGSLSIPAGQTSATITVTPVDDSLFEGPETVIVTLSSNANYVVGSPSTATVTIADDDKPVVSIVAADAAAAEAGLDPGVFTVNRDGITTAPLTVSYLVTGSATNGVDYQLLGGTLTIPAGQSSGNITVTPINDNLFEGSETVIVTLTSNAAYIVGTPNSATVNIADDDKPVVSIAVANATIPESGTVPGIFTVSRDGITTAPLTVGYSVTGTATNGVDYQLLSGTVSILAGQTSADIAVTPIDDSLFEGPETVIVTLNSSANYVVGTPSTASVTISDDDKPVVTVVATDAAAAETGLDPGVFTVTRDGITTAPLTVNYSISGSATNGVDYQLLSGTLTIPAGDASANVVVTPVDDSIAEANETVILTVTAGSGYLVGVPNSATVTIVDNDGPRITASPTSINQGSLINATWSGIINASPTDWIGLYAAGAPNGSYLNWVYVSCTTGPFLAKASGSCNLTVPNVPYGKYETRLLSNDGFSVITTSNSIVVGSAPQPVVTVAATANAAEPTTNGLFTVARIGDLTSALTVNYVVSGSATPGTDYVNIGSSVVIPANVASVTIPVGIIDDNIYEGSETVVVTLGAGSGYTVGNPNSASIIIADNDSPPGPAIAVNPTVTSRGSTVTVNWSGIVNPSPTDWIGLYAVGSGNSSYRSWIYVSCTTGAGVAKAAGNCPFFVPGNLSGMFEVRLLSNDGFNSIAVSGSLTVQ